jgi:hypothetical protein|tara:strand:+ start:348 stop:596 length:249 start_codon:yes stop_codon:yes gene_type:complete
MAKRRNTFKPNTNAPAYSHFERLLKEDREYRRWQEIPKDKTTTKRYLHRGRVQYVEEGGHKEVRSIQEALKENLYKKGNFKR